MPYEQSIVAQWNELMLDAIRSGSAKPTETTYQLHLVSSAIYDAWAAYDTAAYGHYGNIERPVGEHTEANKAEAVSYAAYRALVDFFPNQKATFDAFMEAQGYDPAVASTDPSTAAGVGNLAAQTVLAAREGDGSNRENGYKDTTGYVAVNSPDETSVSGTGGADFDPNAWQPLRIPNGTLTDENGVPIYDNDDPSTYVDQPALTPHWGQVDAFALSSGDQFRPDAPPRLGDFSEYVDGLGNVTTNDQAYRDQFAEVMEMSATLTNREKVIAEYWADGPRTESPPGHWNQIAQDIALREGHGIDDDAKMFFALNAALFDAGIATWDAKYAYNSIRPQSAIRYLYQDQEIEAWGGPDAGTVTMLGQDWQPYQNVTFVPPPFPEFVSGHSTFSMSAANTIAAYVGSDTYYDGTTLGNYDLDHVGGVDLAAGQAAAEQPRPQPFPRLQPLGIRAVPVTQPDRGLPCGPRQLADQRQIQPSRGDDAYRLVFDPKVAHGQRGVIGPRRPRPDHHSVVARAHRMHLAPRLGSGDPLALPRRGGDAAIETRGKLQRDKGAPLLGLHEEPGVIQRRLVLQHAGRHLDPRRAQQGKPLPRNPGIAVLDCRNHPGDTRSDQRLGAGRCLAVVGTGLQRHIGRGPPGQRSGLCQRFDLGMGSAPRLRPAAPDDPAIAHDDAADRRVGPAIALSTPPEGQRKGHVPLVGVFHSSGGTGGRSSWTKSSKSSAA